MFVLVGVLFLAGAATFAVSSMRDIVRWGGLEARSRKRMGVLGACWYWSLIGVAALVAGFELAPPVGQKIWLAWACLGVIPATWIGLYHLEHFWRDWHARAARAPRKGQLQIIDKSIPATLAVRPVAGIWGRLMAVAAVGGLALLMFGTYQQGDAHQARLLGAIVLTTGLVVALCTLPILAVFSCLTWVVCTGYSPAGAIARAARPVATCGAAGLVLAVTLAALEPLALNMRTAMNGPGSTNVGGFSLLSALVVGPAVGAVIGLVIGAVREAAEVSTHLPVPGEVARGLPLVTAALRIIVVPMLVVGVTLCALSAPSWGPDAVETRITTELAHWVVAAVPDATLVSEPAGRDTLQSVLASELRTFIPTKGWIAAGLGISCLVTCARRYWRSLEPWASPQEDREVHQVPATQR